MSQYLCVVFTAADDLCDVAIHGQGRIKVTSVFRFSYSQATNYRISFIILAVVFLVKFTIPFADALAMTQLTKLTAYITFTQ